MAIPTPETMKALWAEPRFREGLRNVVRGYRWRWTRVSGKRWVLERVPMRPIWVGWDLGSEKPTSTVRMPRRVSK